MRDFSTRVHNMEPTALASFMDSLRSMTAPEPRNDSQRAFIPSEPAIASGTTTRELGCHVTPPHPEHSNTTRACVLQTAAGDNLVDKSPQLSQYLPVPLHKQKHSSPEVQAAPHHSHHQKLANRPNLSFECLKQVHPRLCKIQLMISQPSSWVCEKSRHNSLGSPEQSLPAVLLGPPSVGLLGCL